MNRKNSPSGAYNYLHIRAVRALNVGFSYLCAYPDKDPAQGFRVQGSSEPRDPSASLRLPGGATTAAENLLYAVAGTNLVDFSKDDVDAYFEKLHKTGYTNDN